MKASSSLDVLYIGTLPPHPGGTAIVCAQVLAGLATGGHSIRAAAPGTERLLRGEDRFALAHPEIDVTRFLVPYYDITSYSPPGASYRRLENDGVCTVLRRLVAARRPDVLVIGRESFAAYALAVSQAAGLPCVLLVHGAPALAVRDGTYPAALARELLTRFRMADIAVTASTEVAQALRELKLRRVEVVPNPVDRRRFGPRPRDEALVEELCVDDQIVVAHVSNLKALKRPLDLVRSAAKVKGGSGSLVYLVVGDGPYRRAMESACRAEGLLKHFRFTGWREHAELPRYLSLADLVAMPSSIEGQALAYIEAQASGLTLLASDIPAARQVIVNGETGLLFGTGDVDDLAAKTLLAAGDPQLRASIGRAARERTKPHSLPQVVSEYETLLVEAAERGSR